LFALLLAAAEEDADVDSVRRIDGRDSPAAGLGAPGAESDMFYG
jgi:hypothetical protein